MSHGRWLLSSPLRRAQRGPGQPGRSQAPSHCTIVQRPSEDKGLAVGLGLAGRARPPASLPLPGHSGPCPQPSEQEGASPPPPSHPSLSKARPPAPRPSPQEPALGPAPPPAGLTADSHTAIRPSLGLQDPPVPTSSSRDAAPKPSGSAQGHQSPAWCSLGTVLQAWLQSGSLAPTPGFSPLPSLAAPTLAQSQQSAPGPCCLPRQWSQRSHLMLGQSQTPGVSRAQVHTPGRQPPWLGAPMGWFRKPSRAGCRGWEGGTASGQAWGHATVSQETGQRALGLLGVGGE